MWILGFRWSLPKQLSDGSPRLALLSYGDGGVALRLLSFSLRANPTLPGIPISHSLGGLVLTVTMFSDVQRRCLILICVSSATFRLDSPGDLPTGKEVDSVRVGVGVGGWMKVIIVQVSMLQT